MLERKIQIRHFEETGTIGEVKREGEHTFVTHLKLKNYIILVATILPKVGALVNKVQLDEQEMDEFLIYTFRNKHWFFRALDKLSETERNDILGEYFKRGKT